LRGEHVERAERSERVPLRFGPGRRATPVSRATQASVEHGERYRQVALEVALERVAAVDPQP
jgi:hypothetical protein